ncbi:major facilitator superfamily protein [Aspergillus pseudoustus]|uniref:Major facilitator superfamily protein n=1 Tax=Aspergillus pseudoustus TaxID=1810923 RepID=A0ABR4JZ31_9EURO
MSLAKPLQDEPTHSDPSESVQPAPQGRGIWFWLIMAALTVSGLLAALEATIVSTALPSISNDLGGGEKYYWVILAYFLTMTAFQPLFGQLADIFGRRWLLMVAVGFFALGSGLCGGANTMEMLIAGRAIQGLGAGGINVLVETIVCDISPLRERGFNLSILFGGITVGTAIGPVISGVIVDKTTWRWVFYLNLPIAGVALLLLFAFLRLKHKHASISERLRRLDYAGNTLFVAACTSALIGIGWAGTLYPWRSVEVILPLILGLLGLVATLVFEGLYEGTRFCREPLVPLHLFKNRTSAVVFLATFFHGITGIWVLYFLPVYFQSVLMASPIRAGVQLLPTVIFMTVSAVVGGGLMQAFGKYKAMHLASFAFIIIGFGLFTLLDQHSSTAKWVIFQIIESIGLGMFLSTALPAVQAKLSDDDTARATGVWQFLRSFGMVFGSAIPTAIFNTRFDEIADAAISDPAVRDQLVGGKAYEHATRAFLLSVPETDGVRDQVIAAFTSALKRSWQIGIAFAAIGFLLVLVEEQVELRREMKGEFGIEEEVKEEKEKA